MKKNIGIIDSIVRVVFAMTIALLYITTEITGTKGIIVLLFSSPLLITSIISFCPFYILIGFNTSKNENK